LRRTSSATERRLWKELRRSRLGGLCFRRQQPIGPFVVDFFCPSAGLVIELDGPFHSEPGAPERDAARTAWLLASGYRVLRFDNERIWSELEPVLQEIRVAAGAPPSLTLPLKGGGKWIAGLPR
jgi:very-short-patch-repair endonuclease